MTEVPEAELVPGGAERRPSHFPNVARAVTETPWAITEAGMQLVVEIVGRRISGERLTAPELEARLEPRAARPAAVATNGAIAVISMFGVILPRATMFSEISGGVSLEQFQANLAKAVADPQIGSIILNIDSPGGSVAGVTEAAASIRAAVAKKPVVAVVNTLCASAAYWLASQCTEIVQTPSGYSGSIGVYMAHQDISGQQAQDGVKTTLIYAGEFKTEGNPYEALSPEAKAAIQDQVDETYGTFVGDVAKGRGVSVAAVKSGFGQGRVLSAAKAQKAGMVDRVGTLNETINRLAGGGGTPARQASAELPTEGLAATAAPAEEPDDDEAETPAVVNEDIPSDVEPDEEPDEAPTEDANTGVALVPGAEALLANAGFRDAWSKGSTPERSTAA